MLGAVAALVGAHAALGLGPELFGPGLGGLIDIGLVVAAGLLFSLSDREAFWGTPPKARHAKGRSSAAR